MDYRIACQKQANLPLSTLLGSSSSPPSSSLSCCLAFFCFFRSSQMIRVDRESTISIKCHLLFLEVLSDSSSRFLYNKRKFKSKIQIISTFLVGSAPSVCNNFWYAVCCSSSSTTAAFSSASSSFFFLSSGGLSKYNV